MFCSFNVKYSIVFFASLLCLFFYLTFQRSLRGKRKKVPHFIPFRLNQLSSDCQVINSIYLSLKRGTAERAHRRRFQVSFARLGASRRTGREICKSFESSTVTIAVSRSVLDDEKTRNSLLATPSYRRSFFARFFTWRN